MPMNFPLHVVITANALNLMSVLSSARNVPGAFMHLVPVWSHYYLYFYLHLIGLDSSLFQSWNNTPILCFACRTKSKITAQQLQTVFSEEFYSSTLAYESDQILFLHAELTDKLFALSYSWLDFESQVKFKHFSFLYLYF
jgi:hypothetical protein